MFLGDAMGDSLGESSFRRLASAAMTQERDIIHLTEACSGICEVNWLTVDR